MNTIKNKNIGWQRVLMIILPYFIIVGIFQVIGLLIAKVDIFNKSHAMTNTQQTISMFFTLTGTLVTLWVFMKFVDKDPFINLGFHLKNKTKDIVFGFLVGLFIMSFGYTILLLTNELVFVKTEIDYYQILISILMFVFVAISEEVIFRGYILKNLMISFNKYTALIITSLLFAALHLGNPNMDLFSFFNLVLAGIFLGIAYIYTKNLWFPIALHFSWNLFQTLLGFKVSGQESYSIIEFNLKENNLINGGEFGFEGSILSVMFQIVFIIVIVKYFKKESKKLI